MAPLSLFSAPTVLMLALPRSASCAQRQSVRGGPSRKAVVIARCVSSDAAANYSAESLSRRSALTLSAILALGTPSFAVERATAADGVDYAAVRKDILAVISDSTVPGSGIGDKGPTIVRLAWHSSGTYDKISKTGGSGGGTIRFKEELAHGANGGFDAAIGWLEPIHKSHPGLSYADLYTLAGAVAVEAMGGPPIAWRAGRVDAMTPDAVTPDGRLPEADRGNPFATAAGLREVFGRMGFDDREIVALSGAHSLGRCHPAASGYVGPWTGTPTVFGNIYFKLLLKAGKDGAAYWTPDERAKKFQYKDPSGTLMMLPSDLVLVQDEKFKTYVQLYAKEKDTFYADFKAAFEKLEELGTSGLRAPQTA